MPQVPFDLLRRREGEKKGEKRKLDLWFWGSEKEDRKGWDDSMGVSMGKTACRVMSVQR